MDTEKGKSEITNTSESDIEAASLQQAIQVPHWAHETEDENKKDWSFSIRGTNMLKVPCFKPTMMYSIGSAMLTGIAYNLATSKPPGKIVLVTYGVVMWSTWITCRYNHFKSKSYKYTIIILRIF